MKLNPIALNKTGYSTNSYMNNKMQNQNPSFGLNLGESAKELEKWLNPKQIERLHAVMVDETTKGVEVKFAEEFKKAFSLNKQSYIIKGIKGTPENWSWGGFNYFGRQSQEVVGDGILANLESINACAKARLGIDA